MVGSHFKMSSADYDRVKRMKSFYGLSWGDLIVLLCVEHEDRFKRDYCKRFPKECVE